MTNFFTPLPSISRGIQVGPPTFDPRFQASPFSPRFGAGPLRPPPTPFRPQLGEPFEGSPAGELAAGTPSTFDKIAEFAAANPDIIAQLTGQGGAGPTPGLPPLSVQQFRPTAPTFQVPQVRI